MRFKNAHSNIAKYFLNSSPTSLSRGRGCTKISFKKTIFVMKMKTLSFCLLLFLFIGKIGSGQSSPALPTDERNFVFNEALSLTLSDTIDFSPYPMSTIINNQYLYTGALFMGYNGSFDPVVEEYLPPSTLGRVLRSDNWYNALRLSFVDSVNPSQYVPVQRIEFDNPIYPEIDYISIDVYDSMNTVIYHYISTSPEHVTINLGFPSAAYMTFDDSAATAYVIDNIYFDNGVPTGDHHLLDEKSPLIFPNPANTELHVKSLRSDIEKIEIFNLLGEKKYSEVLNKKEETINIQQFSSGVYFMKINGGTVPKKFIVQ